MDESRENKNVGTLMEERTMDEYSKREMKKGYRRARGCGGHALAHVLDDLL
jgi:hypothetical protein